MIKRLILAVLCGLTAIVNGCSCGARGTPELSVWTFNPAMIFPTDRSLKRPEDGVVLSDGRVVVADQVDGLRVIAGDGSSRPFGRFAEAGYLHHPPTVVGGPNGVTLEPSGLHILVADVFRGGLYRVDIATESTQLIYQHAFGINMARADRFGGIWFTQSTRNKPEHGEEELFRSLDIITPDGALYYLPPAVNQAPRNAVQLVGGLKFANGIALDEPRGYLYLSETMGGRITRYSADFLAGRVSDPTVLLEEVNPDNIELDPYNRLWIANPFRNEIIVLDLDTGTSRSVFRISTAASEQLVVEAELRIRESRPWLEIISPSIWEPGPGLITGMALSPDDGPVYVTGLGDALIRLER